MFEHATLQEAYTGSLIAGKGKSLNNIRAIMDKTRLKSEDWTRVRFGAGTPWRRCWCVISPPDEKEIQKLQKSSKKKSVYEYTSAAFKGDVKFYDTRKTKKAQPIATIKDAYSAYAIYPQSKPLIDQSTLVKLEGTISIHTTPESTMEGFVFVMPEVHPAVTGFEIMLRWLFPVYDVFALYGRPTRLIADTLNTRSLMFALPQEKRYGYLEIFDVATLIHTPGSHSWSEQEWRGRLKELTSQRITKLQSRNSRPGSQVGSRRSHRNSLPARTSALRFEDGASMTSQPSSSNEVEPFPPPQQVASAPPGNSPFAPPKKSLNHQRSASESTGSMASRQQKAIAEGPSNYQPSRLSYEATQSSDAVPPPPPAHSVPVSTGYRNPQLLRHAAEVDGVNERSSSESERRLGKPVEVEAQKVKQDLLPSAPPAPVAAPPAFAHEPGAKPQTRPYHSPELRRANSRMSTTTLSQLAAAGNAGHADSGSVNGTNTIASGFAGLAAAGAATAAAEAWRGNSQRSMEDHRQRVVDDYTSKSGISADHDSAYEGLVIGNTDRTYPNERDYSPANNQRQSSPSSSTFNAPAVPSHGLVPPFSTTPRSASPLSASSVPSPSLEPLENSGSIARNFPRHSLQDPNDKFQLDPPLNTNNSRVAPPVPSEQQRPDYINRSSTSRSITRKPLPSPLQVPNSAEPDLTLRKSSLESMRQHAIDDEVLNQIGIQQLNNSPLDDRLPTMASSNYDNESTVSPDYASTRHSTETKRSVASVERPRAGVLKTVGNVDPVEREVVVGDVRYRPDIAKPDVVPDIPDVNFGTTQSYATNSIHGSRMSGFEMKSSHERSRPTEDYSRSPQDGNLSTTLPETQGMISPRPSHNMGPPELKHYRSSSGISDNENQRSVAWQPGAVIGGGYQGSPQSISPEQYVQQRAAANRITPIYAHARKPSNTPPMTARNSSGEHSAQPQSAIALRDLPNRPHSRSPSAGMAATGDISAHLSAREQEHVARITNSPLISMTTNGRQVSPSGGLIGAIEAREREKKEMKEGLSGQMVQHAIAQRQQHQQQLNPMATPHMHIPGQYPETPQTAGFQTPYGGWNNQPQQQYFPSPQLTQQQQQWMTPSAHPSAHIYWNTAQSSSQQQQVPQQPQGQYQQDKQQQSQFYHNGPYSQGQLSQGQQQYNPYFGNGQGGR